LAAQGAQGADFSGFELETSIGLAPVDGELSCPVLVAHQMSAFSAFVRPV
jgi:hypothetical protein